MFNLGENFKFTWRSAPALIASSDEDSFGPASISYDVNMSPGSGQARSNSASRRGSQDKQPSIADVLQAVNALREDNSKTLEAIATTNTRVSRVEERLTESEKATHDLEVKVDAFDLKISDQNLEELINQKIAELVDGEIVKCVEEKIGSKEQFHADVRKLVSDSVVAALGEKLAGKVKELVEAELQKRSMTHFADEPRLRARSPEKLFPSFSRSTTPSIRVLPQVLPKPKDNSDVRVQAAFQDLLASAEAQKQAFVIGMVDEKDDKDRQILPEVPYEEIFRRFFGNIRFDAAKPTVQVANKLPIVRFVVQRDDVHQAKMIVRDRNREMRLLGWWVAQESPKDLRDMNSNAIKFFKVAKETCPELKRVYLQAEDGFVKFAYTPILPVFSIPTDTTKWAKLAPLLWKMVDEVRNVDWVSRQKKSTSISSSLYDEWGDIVDPQSGGATAALKDCSTTRAVENGGGGGDGDNEDEDDDMIGS
jgi:hypothetical protein